MSFLVSPCVSAGDAQVASFICVLVLTLPGHPRHFTPLILLNELQIQEAVHT